MAERKPISKKKRFDIFKRDSFTCQYCGRSAPSIILEIDHIQPVAKGGDNSLLNLITSCKDCNRGKRDKTIDDNSAVIKQKKSLDDLNEMRLQTEMMLKWRDELENIIDEQVDKVANELFYDNNKKFNTNFGLTDFGKKRIKRLIKDYGFIEVLNATDIARDKYYTNADNAHNALDKIGGICYNIKNGLKAGERNGYYKKGW